MVYLVSACLMGENCKYNGGNNRNERVLAFCREAVKKGNQVVAVCPESLGGLESPRLPSEIQEGSGEDVLAGNALVKDAQGGDLTQAFIAGAERVLRMAVEETERYFLSSIQAGVQKVGPMPVEAILKARSPSCGKGMVYDGSFSGGLREGNGVAAALLMKNGVRIITEEEL